MKDKWKDGFVCKATEDMKKKSRAEGREEGKKEEKGELTENKEKGTVNMYKAIELKRKEAWEEGRKLGIRDVWVSRFMKEHMEKEYNCGEIIADAMYVFSLCDIDAIDYYMQQVIPKWLELGEEKNDNVNEEKYNINEDDERNNGEEYDEEEESEFDEDVEDEYILENS